MILSALLATLLATTTANQTIPGDRSDDDNYAIEILKNLAFHEETYPTCILEREFLQNATNIFSCKEIRQKNPFCARNLKVAFSDLFPFIYEIDNKIHGILRDIMEQTLIKRCCLGCNKLEFLPVKDRLQKFTDQLITDSSREKADIVIPAEHVIGNREVVFGHHYSKLISFKSVYVIAKSRQRDTKELVHTLFISTVRSWPLLILALIMAACGGIIVWLADMRQNEEQFPPTFPQGPFEGFWWAYVSMTTVGYGDKSPQSICGRLFAVIWILIGITIFNMFTANITSALSAELLKENPFSVAGKTIGVIKDIKVIKREVYSHQGIIKEFDNIKSMIEALNHGDVAGIAVDDITYKNITLNELFKPQLYWHTESYSVGFASINITLKKMQDTFNRNFMEPLLYGPTITKIANERPVYMHIANAFSLSNRIFVATIGAVVGTSIVGIIAGIIINQCNKKKNNQKLKVEEDLQELNASNENSI